MGVLDRVVHQIDNYLFEPRAVAFDIDPSFGLALERNLLVLSLKQDQLAVVAALTYEWSNGRVK
jgi:hypothetical protein